MYEFRIKIINDAHIFCSKIGDKNLIIERLDVGMRT